jgi:hypothetical protein
VVKCCEPLDLYLEESLRAGDVQISDYREFSLSPGSARGNGFSPGTTQPILTGWHSKFSGQ